MNSKMPCCRMLCVLAVVLGWVNQAGAMNTYRTHGVFFGVREGTELVSIQSNPLRVQDDSESDSYILTLTGVHTAPDGGGTPVPGFFTTPGSVSSELYLYARPSAGLTSYWLASDTIYAGFELWDRSGVLFNRTDIPLHLRTLQTIDFTYTQGGVPFEIGIDGGIPTEGLFTHFEMSAAPKGELLGTLGGADADIRCEVNSLGTQADLWVASPPYHGATPDWDVTDGLLDITITSLSDNPDNISMAHFNGLDYLGNPYPMAQPTLTLQSVPAVPVPSSLLMALIAMPFVCRRRLRRRYVSQANRGLSQ